MVRTSGTFAASRFDLGGSVKLAASKQRDRQRSSEMATDPSEFVSIFSPGGTRLTLPPASPAGSEAGGVGSAQSSQPPAQQGAGGSVVQKILGGPSGSIGSVGGGSDTAGSKTGATEPVTPAPSPVCFGISTSRNSWSGWAFLAEVYLKVRATLLEIFTSE